MKLFYAWDMDFMLKEFYFYIFSSHCEILGLVIKS